MDETGAVMSVVSETWLRDGESLDRDMDDLREGAGMELICKNRRVNERGVAYGGVAIMYKKNAMSLREIKVDSAADYEILLALGNIKGLSRKILVFACYVPPNYSVRKGKDCMSYLTDLVLEMKHKYADPYVIVAGDFNQWDLAAAMEDYVDLVEVEVGPTRGIQTD